MTLLPRGKAKKEEIIAILFCGLTMSLGWRIRGQFGHEFGAAIAGAMGAMAVVLMSGRRDWWRSIHHFALFGAFGWAFGGSMSYMKVVGYAHSSHSPTVFYGFAGLFLLGFLWAVLGGAGVALPALLRPAELGSVYQAIAVVIPALFLQDVVAGEVRRRSAVALDWLGDDWMAAAVAVIAALVLIAVRRRVEIGASLILHLAAGWWVGVVTLVLVLGLHLNPPRGDSWAGCAGLAGGLLVFCWRRRLPGLATTALLAGTIGGAGFALAQAVKLALIATGGEFGWHGVMEWTHGLFFGIALGAGVLPTIRNAPEHEDGTLPVWTSIGAFWFVLWAIPYLNLARSPERWLRTIPSMSGQPYGIPLASHFLPALGWIGWVEAGCIVLGVALVWLSILHVRRPWPFVPESAIGRAQLLFLVFLWSFLAISFVHLEAFKDKPFAFSIQFAMTMHGIVCAVLAVIWTASIPVRKAGAEKNGSRLPLGKLAVLVPIVAILVCAVCWTAKLALFGETFTGYYYTNHIRFGSVNTNHLK